MPKKSAEKPLAELRARAQWVAYRVEERHGKATKVPYTAPRRRADTTKPGTWLTHAAARALAKSDGFAGVGYVFADDDPYTGIDLDKCRNPETGEIEAWAREIVDRFASYTEVTPSATGLHILLKGKLSGSGQRKGRVEVYSRARYFTVTGQLLDGSPHVIESRQPELDTFRAEMWPAPSRPAAPESPAARTDDHAVLPKALARGKEKFWHLFMDGDASAFDGDASKADFALLTGLARFTADPEQIERLARRSQLAREKWDERRGNTTWLRKQIQEALTATGDKREAVAGAPRFHLLTVNDLLTRPDPEWLVTGWLPAGGLGTLFGAYGAGKTFVALDFALSVAAGIEWAGACAVKPGPVIYVLGEGGAGFKLRVRAWCATHGVTSPAALPIRFLTEPVNLVNAEEVTAFLDAIGTERPALIVFDTLSRMIPGADENSQKEMSALIAGADRIRLATGSAVLFLHHQPYVESRMRGSSVLPGAMDAILSLDKSGDTALTLYTTKQKDAEPARPIFLKLSKAEDSLVIIPDTQRSLTDSERVYAYVHQHAGCSSDAVHRGLQEAGAGMKEENVRKLLKAHPMLENRGTQKASAWHTRTTAKPPREEADDEM